VKFAHIALGIAVPAGLVAALAPEAKSVSGEARQRSEFAFKLPAIKNIAILSC
jgi:hypothetical protein